MMTTITIDSAAQLVTALAAVIGLYLVVKQLRAANVQSKLDALTRIHQDVGTKEFRDALTTIFLNDAKDLTEPRSMELFESIRLVTTLYDLLGAGVQEGIYPKRATLRTEWKILVQLWPRLKGFIEYEREHRGLPYKADFQWLAEEAISYQERYYPNAKPKVVKPRELEFQRTDSNSDGDNSGRVLYRGKHLLLLQSDENWEYVSRANATSGVTIVAMTDERHILLVEQHRVPLRKQVIELPAGLVGDEPGPRTESVEEAARRELREETGFECGKVSILSRGPVLPGITDERNTLCLVEARSNPNQTNLVQTSSATSNERIVVHSVPMDTIESWLENQARSGKEIDLRVYAGLFLLKGTFGGRATAHPKNP